ncbi:hypothetical protein V8C86DRAFT_2597874 [Haematococcus lacustris]
MSTARCLRCGLVPTGHLAAPRVHSLSQPARQLISRAGASGSEPSRSSPSVAEAHSILGVSATASFDEVVNAKNKLMSGTRDQQRRMELESAYDVIFMQNMKKRLSGELEVSTSVRYADVPAAVQKKSFRSGTANKAASSAGSGPRSSTLAKLPATAGQWPVVSVPQDTKTLATTAAVFTGLATWALVQASLESPEAQIQDTAGFQLALAFAASLYFMKEKKRVPLGRAFGLSFASLIVGQLAGSLVEQWLRVDIVPIGSFASPGVLVAEFIITSLAAGAILLT